MTDENREDNYIDLFTEVFDSERVILFIPNIKKVSIYIDGQEEPIVREKDNNDWCVSDSLVGEIPDEITDKINDVLENPDSLRSDGYEKIPEKYMNFRKTAVKFACKKDGRKLMPVDDAILYCYLPAKRADWGFNFLMNTDMVPNGQRDDIEDIELNHIIARIAGRQFFYWIKQLIESEEYDLESIFALIPDFDECKKRRVYKTFIEEFQEEFETLIKEEEFIPVVDAKGNRHFERIDNIIDDRTGMSKNNVMSDADFIQLMGMSEHSLPIQELRESERFMELLYHYCPGEMDVDFDDVKTKCSETDFQTWLKNIDNNNKFIKHLLDNNVLNEFAQKAIFVEYEGDLYKANDLYYDFDTNCSRITFLKQFVPHLCDSTRDTLEGDDNWKSFINDNFKSFEASDIINDYIIDNEDAISLLENIDNSISFYRFVAEYEVDLSDVKEKLPYINEDDEASTDYDGLRFFYSENAYNTSKEEWLGNNVINILSHSYFERDDANALKAVFENLGFTTFNKLGFITEIISGDSDFKDAVNEAIENDFDKSVEFFNYIYQCREELKEKSLLFKDYIVSCIDIDGDESYLCNDDLRYFDQSSYAGNSTFADNKAHEWISYTMMYSLNPRYFDGFDDNETKAVESFFRQQFGIRTFTDKSFFADVVLKNKKTIYAALIDSDKIKAFLSYLRRDANHIFDGSLSYNDVKDMPLLCADGTIIRERDKDIKLISYNDDAYALCERDWCPPVLRVVSEEYGIGFSKEALQLLKIENYNFNETLADIISSSSLENELEDADNNVDFWRWIVENYKNIKDFDILKSVKLLDTFGGCDEGETLYISDVYQNNGIEAIVKKYDDNAMFVSSLYIVEEDTKIDNWLKLFKKLGLKSDNKDILLNSILPNLDTLTEDSVVSMMTKHLKDLKEVWNERKSEIKKLQVRTKSGEYKTIDKTLITNIQDESVVEPFKYIELSNEIATDILRENHELLLLVAQEFGGSMLVSEKKIWAEKKIAEYLDTIQEDEYKRDAIHIDFVRELAKLVVDYDISSSLLSRMKYRVVGKGTEYKNIDDITLSSAYSPICDFQANGIDELSYLSDIYIFEGNKDTIKTFFKSQGLHHYMTKDDLKYLAIRDFACYFWSYCFSRRLAEYEIWIEEGFFNNIVCVPTENSVKKASDLYFPWMVVYAAKSPGWRERVPLKAVVDKIESRDARDLFNKLPFNPNLSFEDCLQYLINAKDKREDERQRRESIVNWILAADETDENLVDLYRDNLKALWRNGKGQKIHITELYAIHPDATQERAIFGGDEHVMLTNMFPYDNDSFEEICDIFKIKCLTADDFVSTPINRQNETEDMMKIIKPRLLVLAAIQNPDKYKDIYESYNEIISKYQFYVCDKIDLGYDTIHNDVERIYNDDSHIYYVNSWLHNRTYTKFCSKLKNLLRINVYDNVCEDVLDGSMPIESSIEKYCSSLVYDEEFRTYLNNLDCSVKVELDVEPEPDIDDDYYSDATTDIVKPAAEVQTKVDEPASKEDEADQESDADEDYELISEEDYKIENIDSLEAIVQYDGALDSEDFIRATYEHIIIRGIEDQVVCEHYRNGTWVRGHYRNGYWVNGYWRNGCDVSTHTGYVNDKVENGHGSRNINIGNSSIDSGASGKTNENQTQQTSSTHQSSRGSVKEENNNLGQTDSYQQVDEEYLDGKHEEGIDRVDRVEKKTGNYDQTYNPDRGGYMGSVDNDTDFQPLGTKPQRPRIVRKHPKPFPKDELYRLRSNGTPLELESLEPTKEELDILAQYGISAEQIADTNYLAQLRLYNNLVHERHEEPEESMYDFIRNADDVTTHAIKGGRYIHTCSAARGVMYISPSVWDKMVDDKWTICVYLDGKGKNFHYINSAEEFLKLVEKDDVVIKITGKEKVDVVNELYRGLLSGVKGTAYTLIRVAARTNMDAVFAHYIGAMAEVNDGNEDENLDDYE